MERKTITKEFNGERREIDKVSWYGTIICLLGIMAIGGTLVITSYLKKIREDAENWRPGKIARLEDNLEATNRDGRLVQLKELEDKVWVMAYQYTDCETGSKEMAAVMKDLLVRFGDHPDFHLVSISANPTVDTPEKMDAWIKEHGTDSPRWWFLTGEQDIFSKYMPNNFKILASRTNEEGQIDQDKNLRIVDGKANIRGLYGVSHATGGPTATKLLLRDLEMILDPSKKIADFEPIFFPQ